MPFIVVVARRPARDKPAEMVDWEAFQVIAKLEHLKGLAGVFCLDEAAWIFDTRTALPDFGLVIHQAYDLHLQSYAFRLDRDSLRAHMASYPRSEQLEAFLAS